MTRATTSILHNPNDGVVRPQVTFSNRRRCPIVIFPSLARLARA